MQDYRSLTHSKYDCKYYIVFVPKFRKKTLFGKIRKYLKGVFHELARQKGCEIISGHMAEDHVHMYISIPPKYAVAEIIGYLKGKSAISVARQYGGKQRNFNGENLWARGYAVSTVGFELERELHLYHFTPATIRLALEKAGFRVNRIIPDMGIVQWHMRILNYIAKIVSLLIGRIVTDAIEVHAMPMKQTGCINP